MRAIGLLALLAVLDAGADIAQTGSPSQTIAGGIPPAPIGHRQPRAHEVPHEKNWQSTDPNDPFMKEHRALHRKIKGICRGC
ncbi:MAG: hypothetical protein JO283_01080 [Bradyrhizobium sp.]|nr:hypothetical protein [Bradyrhizobium sp.]